MQSDAKTLVEKSEERTVTKPEAVVAHSDQAVVGLLERYLKKMGYKVSKFGVNGSALAKYAELEPPPRLFFVDMTGTDLTGSIISGIKSAIKRFPLIPIRIIALTTNEKEQAIANVAGANEVINPHALTSQTISFSKFETMVEKLIKRRRE